MVVDGHSVVRETHLPLGLRRQGKVRDVYDLGDEVLLIATDRISAYDVVLPTSIPGKGVMLTRISKFWFDWLGGSVPHHLIEVIEDRSERASTLIAGQVPIKGWHAGIGDPNQADAICDRLLHNAHRIDLKGPTKRKTKAAPKMKGNGDQAP